MTRTVGTLIFGGRGGRCSLGTWFQGMVVPPFVVMTGSSAAEGLIPATTGKRLNMACGRCTVLFLDKLPVALAKEMHKGCYNLWAITT